MKNYKNIFLDVDGTMMNSDGTMPESTKVALRQAQANGHNIFVCTGRPKGIVHDELLNFGFDGFCAATGAYGDYHDHIIFQESFSEEATKSIIDTMHKFDTPFVVDTHKKIYGSNDGIMGFVKTFAQGDVGTENYEELVMDGIPYIESMNPIMDNDEENFHKKYTDITSINFVMCPVSIEEIRKHMHDEARVEKASFYCENVVSGEITLKHCSKSQGISKILDYLKAPHESCVVVGDGPNDKDMMKYGHTSIAMGNAIPEIKKLADYVTTDINDDGIYNAFKHYNLI